MDASQKVVAPHGTFAAHTVQVEQVVPPPQLVAWLGGPPVLKGDSEQLLALLDDVLALARPFGVESVWSSEPRTYRLTPRGRSALARALTEGLPEALIVASDPRVRTTGMTADLTLGSREFPGTARQVSLRFTVPPAVWNETATQVVAFVQRWFAPLRANAAYVSTFSFDATTAAQDDPMVTAYERGPGRNSLWTVWPTLARYLRGVFWGNGLGAGLCTRLGGRERVLADAPVALAQPLGDGVWLQLSGAPPAAPEDLARLSAYLAPLLGWTMADVTPLAPPRPVPSHQRPLGAATPSSAPARPRGRAVPIRLTSDLEADVALNVLLDASPTDEQRAAVEATVDAWYGAGFEGAFPSGFGEGVFHSLSSATHDGTVLRWQADLGSADPERAIRDLARRLGALPGVKVRRLVVGTEEVG